MQSDMKALKGALRERGKTYRECAVGCGMSLATFNSKINGKQPFTCWEVKRIGEFLDLSSRDIVRIFLYQNLHSMQGQTERQAASANG